MHTETPSLPLLIAGPILRHIDNNTFSLWLVCSQPCELCPTLIDSKGKVIVDKKTSSHETHEFVVGKHAFVYLLTITKDNLFECGQRYGYTLHLNTNNNTSALLDLSPQLFYKNQKFISFWYQKNVSKILHGSCRKPHFDAQDALVQIDHLIEKELEGGERRPDLLLMTGDQIYADDVAGPTLVVIHQVIKLLALHDEEFSDTSFNNTDGLYQHPNTYYQREQLIPDARANSDLAETFFKGKRKPVFTSVNAQNHLMSFAEVMAMYFLSWSPTLWSLTHFDSSCIPTEHHTKFNEEQIIIEKFVEGLSRVQRGLAHIPSYMIFDDHDVTDDWNLTRDWEEKVYGNTFSKRIIGNALLAYFVCQASGNPLTSTMPLLQKVKTALLNKNHTSHNRIIDDLFAWSDWHYSLNTNPPIQVLDTRTQRWRSESNANKPSGLMDWEGLCDLQHQIIDTDAVIIVSAAPIYGVKFIETVQRVFTMFGGELMVDAENWMAHRGTAKVMLNIFRHMRTPPHFIILSGDVHYSFVYDVRLRFTRNSPKITQFTSSGIKNEFPPQLLNWFERLNRWFYSPDSPLNILTKRRNMSVEQQVIENSNNTLFNKTNIGLLTLDEDNNAASCDLLCGDGGRVRFSRKDNTINEE